jgi:hypothetical protein
VSLRRLLQRPHQQQPSANTESPPHRSLSSRNIVRIVARCAFHRTFAFQKTLRTANAIHRVHDLELVLPSTARRMIEEQPVFAERLAWSKVERSPLIALHGIRKRKTRCLEVALDADLFTPLWAQSRRIHNCFANCIRRCLAGTSQFVVLPARPVTPLAVNPSGERIQVHWLGKRLFMPWESLDIRCGKTCSRRRLCGETPHGPDGHIQGSSPNGRPCRHTSPAAVQ